MATIERRPSDTESKVSMHGIVGWAGLMLGAVGAKVGGANVMKATARVTFWGALAMAATAGVGAIFGVVA